MDVTEKTPCLGRAEDHSNPDNGTGRSREENHEASTFGAFTAENQGIEKEELRLKTAMDNAHKRERKKKKLGKNNEKKE